jgi:tetratricopeptide (TPR) repeat protein
MKKLPQFETNPLSYAIAGFFGAVLLFVLVGGYLLFSRSMERANSLIGLNATNVVPADTSLETPLGMTKAPSPSGGSLGEYETLFNSLEAKIYTDPQFVLETLATLLEQQIPVLDAARAHHMLSEANEFLGDFDIAEIHRRAIIDGIDPQIESFTNALEIGEVYYFLIDSTLWLGEYELAGEYDQQLSDKLVPALSQLATVREIGEAYSALIQYETVLGDYEQAQAHNTELIERMLPLINDLTAPGEIAVAYEFLINSNVDLGQTDKALIYNDELIGRLTPLIDTTDNPEDLAAIYLYLGNAEFTRGRYQFAAAHFDKLVRYDRTPSTVYSLAYYFSLSGDNPCAYHWFSVFLAEFGETENQENYVPIAEQSITSIEELYSGNVPDCP